MPNILANIAKMDSATTGTGTLTLGSAVAGYLSFANAGVTSGQVVTYAIEDYDASGNIIAREVGAGTYSSTGPTLTRDTVYSSTNAGAKINCSGLQYVFVSLAKEDLATFGVLSAVNTWTANNYFTTGNVGIGTTSPSSPLHVVSASNFQPQIIADHVAGAGTGAGYFLLDRARGTIGAKTAVVSGDPLGTLMSRGYDGSALQNAAWISFDVDGAVSAGNVPTGMTLFTTPVGGSAASRMHIDADGSVGIGTTGPTSRLTITGGITEIRDGNYLMLRPSGNGWDMRLQATGTQLDILSGGALGSPIMSLVNGGNVGIGTTTPSSKLSVSDGTVRIDLSPFSGSTGYVGTQSNHPLGIITNNVEAIRVTTDSRVGINTGTPGSYDAKLAVFNGNFALTATQNKLYLYYASSTNHAHISTDTGGQITFTTGTAAPSEKVRIDTSGNVGIGVTSPTFRFVAGNSATDAGWIYSASGVSYLGLGGFAGATDGAFQLAYDRSNGNITLSGGTRDTPTPRVRIDNNGDVGIGTTTIQARVTVQGASGGASLYLTDNVNSQLLIKHQSPNNLLTYETVGTATQRWVLNSTERLRLDSNGILTIANDVGPASADTLAVGFRGAPHNDQTGTTYTFVATDAGRAVMFKGTANATWTIPLSTTTDFPVGTMIIVDNSHFGSGTVNVTVQGATGVGIRSTGAGEATTGRANNKQVARGGVMTLRKLSNRSATQSVTSITRVGTTATLTSAAAHGYIVGDYIEVAGAAQSQYNGSQRVLTVGSTTTLTYAMTADPGASASGTLTVRLADLWNATGNYSNA
jgi:hypothetical protein